MAIREYIWSEETRVKLNKINGRNITRFSIKVGYKSRVYLKIKDKGVW